MYFIAIPVIHPPVSVVCDACSIESTALDSKTDLTKDSLSLSLSRWCWAIEMMAGGWLDSHHLSVVPALKPEFPLFIFPFLPLWPPSAPPPLNIWNAIMDQWAPPSVALLVNIYWVEQQPLPSLERGALQSLGAILYLYLCMCACVRVRSALIPQSTRLL